MFIERSEVFPVNLRYNGICSQQSSFQCSVVLTILYGQLSKDFKCFTGQMGLVNVFSRFGATRQQGASYREIGNRPRPHHALHTYFRVDSEQLYEREKSSVFSLPRKTGSDDDARTDSDRLFQTDATAAGKARSPMVERRVRGPTSADCNRLVL